MAKWKHCRKGIIEGKIVKRSGEYVLIKIKNRVRMGRGSPMLGTGFRGVYAEPGDTISVRESFLEPMPKGG